MWKFSVKNQKIEIIDREVIASDQIQFVNLKFIFDGQWKELHKVVQFTQCDETYNRVLGTDGLSCLLPAELHAGTVMMSVFGYETDNIQALRATTVPVILHIRQSGFVGDDINVPPTPDLYQQLLAEIKNNGTGSGQNGADGKDGVNGLSAYEIAVQEGFAGSVSEWLESLKGKDGRDGKDGVNGVDGKNGTDGKDGKDGADGLSAYEIAVNNGFIGSEAEWLDSLKGKDGKDGVNGVDGKNGADGKDGKDGVNGLSAYEIAVQEGFIGSVSEWLVSLKGKDGRDGKDGNNGVDGTNGIDGINGRDGTNGIDGKDGHDGINGVDGRDGKNGLSAYEIATQHGFIGTESEWLESLHGADGKDGRNGTDGRDGINGKDGTSPDLTELNLELSEFQQIIDELKYNSELYEERISYLERNANCQSQIVFRYGATVPRIYADSIYTFYNDGYRNLSGFTQTYPNFCSADNDYALYINQTDFGWGGAVYVMFITPIQVKQSSQLSVTYLSGATDNAEFYLIETKADITSKSDLARYIYDKIESYDCEKVAFKWLQSDDYITQLIDLSAYPAGNYYLAFKGVSDNTHPKIKEIKVRED